VFYCCWFCNGKGNQPVKGQNPPISNSLLLGTSLTESSDPLKQKPKNLSSSSHCHCVCHCCGKLISSTYPLCCVVHCSKQRC